MKRLFRTFLISSLVIPTMGTILSSPAKASFCPFRNANCKYTADGGHTYGKRRHTNQQNH